VSADDLERSLAVGDRVVIPTRPGVGTVSYRGSQWTCDVRWDDGRHTCEVVDHVRRAPVGS